MKNSVLTRIRQRRADRPRWGQTFAALLHRALLEPRRVEITQQRKQTYKDNGVTYYRPWLFLITDGSPTDSIANAKTQLKRLVEEKGVVFFAVGVKNADMGRLKELAGDNTAKLDGLNFSKLFEWLSASMQRVSQSKPGDMTELPPPDSWAAIGS